MTELELLKHEVAQLQADGRQKSALLEQNAAVLKQKAAVLEQEDALLAEQSATIAKQEVKLEAQQLEINRLIQHAFGRHSERYLESPQQLQLDFGDGPEVADAADGLQQAVDENIADGAADAITVGAHDRKRSRNRNDRLPENIPRIEVIADVPARDKACDTHGGKTLIGYDTTETLTYTPPKLEVIVTKYPKFACPGEPGYGVVQAARPESLIEGNRYDTSIAAEIITAKYGYHLPFYRQQDRRGRHAWSCRSKTVQLPRPISERMTQRKTSPAAAGRRSAARC